MPKWEQHVHNKIVCPYCELEKPVDVQFNLKQLQCQRCQNYYALRVMFNPISDRPVTQTRRIPNEIVKNQEYEL